MLRTMHYNITYVNDSRSRSTFAPPNPYIIIIIFVRLRLCIYYQYQDWIHNMGQCLAKSPFWVGFEVFLIFCVLQRASIGGGGNKTVRVLG